MHLHAVSSFLQRPKQSDLRNRHLRGNELWGKGSPGRTNRNFEIFNSSPDYHESREPDGTRGDQLLCLDETVGDGPEGLELLALVVISFTPRLDSFSPDRRVVVKFAGLMDIS